MRKSFILQIALLVLSIALIPQTAQSQIFKSKDKKEEKKPKKTKKNPKKNGIKPYDEIITKDAISDEGMFSVHRVEEKHYFELPNSLLGEEILVVSRISGFVKNLNFGGAGMKSRPQQVVRFERHNNSILMRSVSYNSVASETDPIYQSVVNNNFEPVIYKFPIEAFSEDSNSVVINVDPLFTTDIEMIGALYSFQRKAFQIRGLDSKRSMITGMRSFPQNVQVKHTLTYRGGKLPSNGLTGTLSVGMTQSFVMLPKEPMKPRLYDARVGYFSIRQTNYSLDEHKAASRRYITKWRLEPSDMEAYLRGDLVEPKKPIVYYIDPATPKKWIPWLKKGIEDWQPAFEKAGFKNAIIAKEPPSAEEDPDWSPEDIRYSVIRYITTDIQNAQGPHVHDPRTGEILESDILWYHNIMNLLRNWFFIQTAASNPKARTVKMDDEIMGEMIRFVCAHEVGHTLGLPHNMGSSHAFPVDSLRSPSFTAKHGTAPSIMDYARFNYIAQPEDGVTNYYPAIGEYDNWSIIYGYKPIPEASTAEEERLILNNWVKARADDPIYRYGRQRFIPVDPTAQTEDLSNDAVEASTLGVMNLKRIVPELIEWTDREGADFSDMSELYGNVVGQFRRYAGHVTNLIGGVYEWRRTHDEDKAVYEHISREKQQEALEFLNKNVFQTPDWLIDKNILMRIEEGGSMNRIRAFQDRALSFLYFPSRLNRLIENETLNGASAFTIGELFTQSREAIFAELNNGDDVDTYRRNLQRAYVDVMGKTTQHQN